MKKQPNPIIKFFLYFILIFTCLLTGCDKIINNTVPTSTPQLVEVPQPVPTIEPETIIIQPQSQEVEENGFCSFMAVRSDNAQGTWYFISPDWDAQYSINTIKDYAPTLTINIIYNELRLNYIPRTMNGWNVYCAYPDGSTTEIATITIKNLNNNEDPYLN